MSKELFNISIPNKEKRSNARKQHTWVSFTFFSASVHNETERMQQRNAYTLHMYVSVCAASVGPSAHASARSKARQVRSKRPIRVERQVPAPPFFFLVIFYPFFLRLFSYILASLCKAVLPREDFPFRVYEMVIQSAEFLSFFHRVLSWIIF